MRPVGSPEELQRRRERALALLKEGVAPVDVANRVGVDRRSVRRWKAAFRDAGAHGIAARPAPGRPCALTAQHKRRLEQWLLKGARACGFPTDLWTCARVAQVIRDRLGVDYHVDHVGRVLHALGWSPQKPVRRAIERDEAAIARWIREDWARIKKTPPAGARRSSSSTKRVS
jgi:transposase